MRTHQPIERCSEQTLRLHLKALDVGLWDYDLDADNLNCDDRWYRMLMLEPGSVRRIAAFMPYIHPDDRDVATAIDPDSVTTMIEGDARYHIDFRVIRSDGGLRWWRSVACVVRDPETGHRRAIGCVSDITASEPSVSASTAVHASDVIVAGSTSSTPGLTSREVECLRWVSVGKTAWETAQIMGRSPRTVEFHLQNATHKLGASNKIHAAVIAVRWKLI